MNDRVKYRDSCASNRPVADLLRWSMGSRPRYGKAYTEYEAPKTLASPAPTAGETRPLARRIGEFGRRAGAALRRAIHRRRRDR